MLESFLPLVKYALSEDVGTGDVTTLNSVPSNVGARAVIVAKEAGVVSGLEIAQMTFREVDDTLKFRATANDGDYVEAGIALAQITGSAASIMTAERTALNFMMRMCGVATQTRRYVAKIDGTGATILDTRKTTPGLRAIEKAAVRCGGGTNHRLGLYDAILIKDNHLCFARSIGNAIEDARAVGLNITVECETLAQVREAVEAGANRILLDNMDVARLRQAVGIVAGRTELEASGGVTLANVRAIAETGVDHISVGALTHRAPSLDVSLEIVA